MTVKVPLYGSPIRAVQLDERATEGAVFGVNLKWPDGTVVKKSDLVSAPVTGGGALTTTDDLDEGQWNLWFTPRRAQDAVGAILADSANVTLRYVGGTSIEADLTDLVDSGAGALLAITRDAFGRVTGTRAATITGTAGRVTVADGDASAGLPTIDLDAVPDDGGGALLRFVRDAWGRISGTSAATTTDLTEGSNLYFTAARVLATVLAGLSTATNAVITATDTVLSALGKLQAQITGNAAIPMGYIDGLKMVWNSATSISVTSGTCYIQGSSAVISFPSTLTLSGLSLSASTWYHLYGYLNSGTPAIELVTTAPAVAYSGTARSKTGDTSRRYIGSVRTDASGNALKFLHNSCAGYVIYLVDINNAQLLILSGGASTSDATVSAATAAPVTSRVLRSFSENPGTTGNGFISNADIGTPANLNIAAFLRPAKQMFLPIEMTSSQTFSYLVSGSSTLTVWATGYDFER